MKRNETHPTPRRQRTRAAIRSKKAAVARHPRRALRRPEPAYVLTAAGLALAELLVRQVACPSCGAPEGVACDGYEEGCGTARVDVLLKRWFPKKRAAKKSGRKR